MGIWQKFLRADEAQKRRNALCLLRFCNSVRAQKDRRSAVPYDSVELGQLKG